MTRTAKLTLTREGLINDSAGRAFERTVFEMLRQSAMVPPDVVALAWEVVHLAGDSSMPCGEHAEELAEKAVALARRVLEACDVEMGPPIGPVVRGDTVTMGPELRIRSPLWPTVTLLWGMPTNDGGFSVQLFDDWTGSYPPEKILRGLGRRVAMRALEGWLPEFGPGEFSALTFPG